MLAWLRLRQPGSTLGRILWWHFLHLLCYVWFAPCYRFRAWGYQGIPTQGPVLLLSNHQSFLDPIVVGLAAHHRQFYALARSSLFDHAVLGWVIRSINAVGVDRGESDVAAMRKCIDVLKSGHALLVFPEGTRTPDGVTQPFASGVMLLLKRANPLVVPVAIQGAYDVWPKGRKRPRATGLLGVLYGQPIPAQTLLAMGSQGALDHLRGQVEDMRLELASRLESES